MNMNHKEELIKELEKDKHSSIIALWTFSIGLVFFIINLFINNHDDLLSRIIVLSICLSLLYLLGIEPYCNSNKRLNLIKNGT